MSSPAAPTPSFLETVEGDILAVGKSAWTWLEGELVKLGTTILADLRDLAQEAINEAQAGDSTEVIVTKILNMAESRGMSLIVEIETDILAGIVALGRIIPQ